MIEAGHHESQQHQSSHPTKQLLPKPQSGNQILLTKLIALTSPIDLDFDIYIYMIPYNNTR